MTHLFDNGRTEIACAGARFILIERWAPGPLIGYLGMNPSRAGEFTSDPSFQRFNGFARRWGFSGTIWANLLPFRSSKPDEALAALRRAIVDRDSPENGLLVRNLDEITQHRCLAALWMAGWGNGGEAFDKLSPALILDVTGVIEGDDRTEHPMVAFGLTGEPRAAPKHVLARGLHRIPDDASVYAFDPLMRTLGDPLAMPWSPRHG